MLYKSSLAHPSAASFATSLKQSHIVWSLCLLRAIGNNTKVSRFVPLSSHGADICWCNLDVLNLHLSSSLLLQRLLLPVCTPSATFWSFAFGEDAFFAGSLLLLHFYLGKLYEKLNFFEELFVSLLMPCLELSSIGLLCPIERLLELGHRVEFALAINFCLNVVKFIFSGLKIVSHILEYLPDGLLVGLFVVPRNQRRVDLPLHVADASMIAMKLPLIIAHLHDFFAFERLSASESSQIFGCHLLQARCVEALRWLKHTCLH